MTASEAKKISIKSCENQIKEVEIEIEKFSLDGHSQIEYSELSGGTIIYLLENGFEVNFNESLEYPHVISWESISHDNASNK